MIFRQAAIVLALIPSLAFAQALTAVKVEPAQAKTGAPVNVTADFEVSGAINCGLLIDFGDGNKQKFKINQQKDVPLVVSHVYAKPGTYKIMAEPKRNEMVFGCTGKNQYTQVVVAADAAKVSGPQCPDGWKLNAKSVNKKTGAFSCTAKAGTKSPESKLVCPDGLGYYEEPKKNLLGCK